MKAKKHLLLIVLVLALAGFACGELDMGIEEPSLTPETATLTPDVSVTPETEQDVETTSQYAQYWQNIVDPRTGVGFAIPCFWVAEIPLGEQDPTGYGSFSVNNFTSDFVSSLGNKQAETVWTIGGMKFDLGYAKYGDYNLSSGTLIDLANAMYSGNDESQITALVPMTINGQAALRVDSTSGRGDGRFYLLDYSSEMAVMVAPFPLEVDASPDFQGILNSFSLSPNVPVSVPDLMPAAPPEGMSASCLGEAASATPTQTTANDSVAIEDTLDCTQVTDADALMWVVCNVRDSFVSRNTQPLWGYMGDIFQLGYWQSEGRSLTRDEAMQEIIGTLMPDNTGQMTFTTDQAQFPPLFGMPPETMFGPDANIVQVVYSEGWGQDGNGAVLLYFAQDQDESVYFYGLVFSGAHFDK